MSERHVISVFDGQWHFYERKEKGEEVSFYGRNAERCARCTRLLGPDDSPLGCGLCEREDAAKAEIARAERELVRRMNAGVGLAAKPKRPRATKK